MIPLSASAVCEIRSRLLKFGAVSMLVCGIGTASLTQELDLNLLSEKSADSFEKSSTCRALWAMPGNDFDDANSSARSAR